MPLHTIGIDVGGTKTAYGIFDENQNIIKKFRHESDTSLSSEEFFDVIIKNIKNLCAECGLELNNISAIGIGMPSFVLYEEGYIIRTTNLTNIKDFNARKYLEQKLSTEIRIVIDNDSHTAALAEYRHGAGKGFLHMIYCPISTGISSGIVINGELFHGSDGCSGESGHMIITPNQGVECGCGNVGCFMSYTSGSMIVKHIKKWIEAGEPTVMIELAGSADKIDAFYISEAYKIGDKMAIKAINQMGYYLAVWLYNLYITFNINCFVFGGGLLNIKEILFPIVEKEFGKLEQNNLPIFFKTAELGEDFGIIGANELLF